MMEFFLAMNPPTVTHQEHKVAVVSGIVNTSFHGRVLTE